MLISEEGRELDLRRWPPDAPGPLQAWDAADEHALRALAADFPGAGPVLLVDDAFGALATALDRRTCTVWSDSHLARLALAANLEGAGRAADAVAFAPADGTPAGAWDLAVVRIPRAMDGFAERLARLRGCLAPDALVLAAGMIKHTPMRAWRLLEQQIGPTRTSQGWKKSRLAVARLDPEARPAPPRAGASFGVPGTDLELGTWPGVFGGGRLDRGTALLLEHLPAGDAPLRAADLGCGNGVLALALALRLPAAEVLGVDESYLAAACARENLARNAGRLAAAGRVTFRAGDGLWDVEPGTLDLVVCNPPFHAGHAVADGPAWRMINQAHRALRPGGELRLVGNRHLGYHVKLRRVFGNCRVLGASARFVALAARR